MEKVIKFKQSNGQKVIVANKVDKVVVRKEISALAQVDEVIIESLLVAMEDVIHSYIERGMSVDLGRIGVFTPTFRTQKSAGVSTRCLITGKLRKINAKIEEI